MDISLHQRAIAVTPSIFQTQWAIHYCFRVANNSFSRESVLLVLLNWVLRSPGE